MASVKRNFLFNILLVTSNIVFPVLVFPYIARILGPQGLGNAHFALQFSKYFVTTASLGIPIYGLREVAKVKNHKAKLSKLVSELLLLNIITAFLSFGVYAIVLYSSGTLAQNFDLFAIASLQVLLGFLAIDWLFAGLEDFKIITVRSLTIRLITVLFLLFFVKTKNDVFPYLLISILSILLGHLWNLFYATTKVKFSFKNLNISAHLKPIFIIFLMNLCIAMYTIFDTVWVGFLSTATAVGMYISAVKLSKIGIPIVSALGTVLLPRSARTFAANINNPIHLQTSFNFIVDLAVPIGVGMFLLAPELLFVFSGAAFSDALIAMRLLSFLPLFIGLSNLFGMQILSASGNDKLVLKSVFIGMLINVVLNVILVPKFAHNGAALAIVITEGIVTLVTFYFAFKKFAIRFNTKRFARDFAACVTFLPLIWLFKTYLTSPSLIIVGSLTACAIIYLSLQHFWFKNEFVNQAIVTVKKKLNK
ncbi:MAG: flippase [Bacteroidia bacterium]|nr:flippase [Bacteroidia bacterium]